MFLTHNYTILCYDMFQHSRLGWNGTDKGSGQRLMGKVRQYAAAASSSVVSRLYFRAFGTLMPLNYFKTSTLLHLFLPLH